jgi:hypothetical protein
MKLYKSKHRFYINTQKYWYKIACYLEMNTQVIRIANPVPYISLRMVSPLELLVVTSLSLEKLKWWINRVDESLLSLENR